MAGPPLHAAREHHGGAKRAKSSGKNNGRKDQKADVTRCRTVHALKKAPNKLNCLCNIPPVALPYQSTRGSKTGECV
jgi:hypothetical protein